MKPPIYTFFATLALFAVLWAAGCNGSATAETRSQGIEPQAQSAPEPKAPSSPQPAAADKEEKGPNGFDEKPPAGIRAYCPVMETNFTVTEGSPHSVYKGKHYVFCCPPCKDRFDKDPQKYI